MHPQPPFVYETPISAEALKHAATRCREQAEAYLTIIEKTAREAGVACDVVYEEKEYPYDAIIRVAEQIGCDLIMMASHGRRGGRGAPDRQRDSKGADPLQDPGAAVSLNRAPAVCGGGLTPPGDTHPDGG
jgi:hypothetical protein